jgi:hypothetical protein
MESNEFENHVTEENWGMRDFSNICNILEGKFRGICDQYRKLYETFRFMTDSDKSDKELLELKIFSMMTLDTLEM